MPYADKEKQREAQARSYARRLQDPEFRGREAERKAAWLATEAGARSNRESSALARARRAR